jgi:transcriptional regulator with XRE-family HTH domain
MSVRGRWPRKDYTPEEVDYLKFIGLKIRRRRKQLKLSQTNVGKMIFTTFQQVQKYEKGINVINNIKLERLRNALCIPKDRIGFLTNKYNGKTDIAKEEYADNPTISFEMKDGELVVKGNPFNEKTNN